QIRFLQPWAQRGLTPKQWQDVELLIHRSLSSFIRLMNKAVKDAGEGYPFVPQFSPGCELHPNGSSTQYCDAGMNGEDFISFDAGAGTWLARQGDKLALEVWDLLSQDRGTTAMLQSLLRTTGVHGIKSLVQHGRESLERQGQRPCRIPEGCGISDRLGQRSGVSPPSPQRGLPQPPNLLPLLCNGTMTSPARSSGPRGWKNPLGVLSVLTAISKPFSLCQPASVTLRLLQINVFHNASSTDMEGMALLGDLETHSLDCSACQIRFLHTEAVAGPGAADPSLPVQLQPYCEQDSSAAGNGLVSQPDPFVTQGSLGCELHPNGTSRAFDDTGVNGEDFISFDADAGKWVARQGDKLALYARDLLNLDKGTAITLQFLLRTTCVNQIKSFVQHGNESLERQVPG
ncbi:Antigen-presenting glycoprotein CD1d, partial [Chelonia mydas]